MMNGMDESIAGGQTSFRRVDNSLGRNGSFTFVEEKLKKHHPAGRRSRLL